MITHILIDEKFSPNFLKFLFKYYPDHKVIIYHINKELEFCKDFINDNRCFFLDRRNEYISKYKDLFEKSEQIVLHSLFLGQIYTFFFRYPSFSKKSIFVVWGDDVYGDNMYRKHLPFPKNIKDFVRRYMKACVIKEIPKFMTFATGDFELIKKWYGTDGKQYDCLYPSTVNKNELDNSRVKHRSSVVNIMVGNSSTRSNNHIEVFRMLAHYKDENIRIICPLSYGDFEYRREVISQGKSIFGGKFVALTKYLTPDKYAGFLSTIDIAIFHQDRQQATGNIEIVSYYGAKVYLKSTATTWDYYVNKEKRHFFDSLEIPSEPYDQFVELSDNDKKDNCEYFSRIWDERYIKELWDKVLK